MRKADINKIQPIVKTLTDLKESDSSVFSNKKLNELKTMLNNLETMEEYYQDKYFSSDYDSKYYDYYDSIQGDLNDAVDELSEIVSNIESIRYSIDSTLSSLSFAMLEIHD